MVKYNLNTKVKKEKAFSNISYNSAQKMVGEQRKMKQGKENNLFKNFTYCYTYKNSHNFRKC